MTSLYIRLCIFIGTALLCPSYAAADKPRVDDTGLPNDPLLKEQWYLFSPDESLGRKGSVNAVNAWERIRTAKPVVVVILDGGVNWKHPDLVANVWRNEGETINGLDDDRNGYVDDLHGWDFAGADGDPSSRRSEEAFDHGTMVAGLIAAVPNNEIGIAGVARNVKFMPLRVFGEAESASRKTVPEAIRYAVRNGARVIVSTGAIKSALTTTGKADAIAALQGPLAESNQKGVLVVESAGNDASSNDDDLEFLGRFSNLLIVGGTMQDGQLSKDLSYGKMVRLAAPCERMVFPSFEGYTSFATPGTSFAVPVAAGIAATIWSQRPDLTPAELIAILRESAIQESSMRGRISGGRVDMERALKAALN